MVSNLICGTSWVFKSKTEKVTGGRKSAILTNCCCLLSITVLSTPKAFKGFINGLQNPNDGGIRFNYVSCKKSVH